MKERHHRIANVFINESTVSIDHRRHDLKVVIHKLEILLGIHALR